MSKPETTTDSQPESSAAKTGQSTVVEEYPVGMTAEQMRKSNSQAVAELEKAAADKAVAGERQRLSDLRTAFADDAAFALQAYDEGLDVNQAKAKRHDELVKTNSELQAENAKLKESSDVGTVEFVTSDVDGTTAADTGEAGDKTVDAKAAKLWAANESIREEFVDQASFAAYYARHPEEFKTK